MGTATRIGVVVVVLAVAGAAGLVIGVGDDGPNPEVVDTSKPTAQLVEQNATRRGDGYEFAATIQNTGQAGEVRVSLWNGTDAPAEAPDDRAAAREAGFERLRTGDFYFDGGERRAVTFTEGDLASVEGYAFFAFAGTYSAEIRNEGGAGDVNASLLWVDERSGDQELVASKRLSMAADETATVDFDVEEHPRFDYPERRFENWRVVVEPAE